MKFKAPPNLQYVKISNKYVQRVTGIKGFYFDDKGEFETDNEVLIKVLSQNFEVVEEKEVKTFKCKKCKYETGNKGDLLAHYRSEHKKEES
jgi:hypothetical protein